MEIVVDVHSRGISILPLKPSIIVGSEIELPASSVHVHRGRDSAFIFSETAQTDELGSS